MERDSAHAWRVLLVDDNPGLVEVLRDSLALLGGYDVFTASDGAEGLVRFDEVQPDCVVVDVRMPGLDGYQFVRALRGDPVSAQTPIVMLSALTRNRETFAGLLTGADAYLHKPAKLEDLLAAIARAVRLTDRQRRDRQALLAGQDEL